MNVSCSSMSLNTFRCIIETRLNIIERSLNEDQKKQIQREAQEIKNNIVSSKEFKH